MANRSTWQFKVTVSPVGTRAQPVMGSQGTTTPRTVAGPRCLTMHSPPLHGARQPCHHPAGSLLTICLTLWGLGLQCILPIVLPGSPASHLGIKTSPLTPPPPSQRGNVVGKKHPSGPGGHLIPKSPGFRAPQASSPTLPQPSQALSSGISKLARPGRGAGNVNSVCLKCQ